LKVVHSFSHGEELMDQAVIRFQRTADRENRRRQLRRRYSRELQQEAVEYWRERRGVDGVRTIAAALGVSVTTLQRWTRGVSPRPRFWPIEVREPAVTVAVPVTVTITADGPRVDGLTVETAARLLTLLR
jgi:transposase-like protein